MQQIQDIIISGAMGILTILAGIVVKAVKDFLIAKGGEKSIKIVEILAQNAVNAVEQVSKETGYKGEEKLSQAKGAVLNELEKYNIYMPEKDLDLYIESAVKQMESNWKGDK
nr:MAG TPA: holin [Bacteriophage sp.]